MTAFISIVYDGIGKNLKYNCVKVSYDNETKIFDSGNFVKDWFDCQKDIIFSQKYYMATHSSSVNHFFMDGAEYDSYFLCEKDDVWFLSNDDNGIEFFVEKGTKPTWGELKDICN